MFERWWDLNWYEKLFFDKILLQWNRKPFKHKELRLFPLANTNTSECAIQCNIPGVKMTSTYVSIGLSSYDSLNFGLHFYEMNSQK